MDAAELRALQAPHKERYKVAPQSAVITLKAYGTLGDEGITCSVDTGKAMVEAGLHPATGGDGLSACSGDMLLQALAACAGVPPRAPASPSSRWASSAPSTGSRGASSPAMASRATFTASPFEQR